LYGVLLLAAETAEHFVFFDTLWVLESLLRVSDCSTVNALTEGKLLLTALLMRLLLRGVA